MQGNLVLTLKPGQALAIGESIIRIYRHGGSIRIAIKAPAHIRILRAGLEPESEGKDAASRDAA